MSQRISNVNANFVNPAVDPAQTIDGSGNPSGGIEGITGGAIVLRVGVNGPSGVNNQPPSVIVTPSFTVT